MNEKLVFQVPAFTGENVPVAVAAKVMKKDPLSVRLAMQNNLIDLGYCQKKPDSNQYDYYISPMKLWLLTGYIYKGEES